MLTIWNSRLCREKSALKGTFGTPNRDLLSLAMSVLVLLMRPKLRKDALDMEIEEHVQEHGDAQQTDRDYGNDIDLAADVLEVLK